MAISGLGYSGAESTLSLLSAGNKPAPGTRVHSAGNEGSYIQTSPDISHPVTTDIDAINLLLDYLPDVHAASNPNLLVYSLAGDLGELGSSQDLAGVQAVIKSYTDSFSAPSDPDYPDPAPSAKFLADLKAIGDAAASGDPASAKSALDQARDDSPANTPSVTTPAQQALLNNAYIRDGLEEEGYSVSDATAQADAITIGGLVPSTTDPVANKKRSAEISDLARVLAMEAGASDKKTAEASSQALADIVNSLAGATSADAANQSLASFDQIYGSQSLTVQG
jgi:hypothetical protein